jgi:hypothetical protein
MRFDKEKFPALFDNDIVLREYEHLLNPIVKRKMKDVIDGANTVRTYLARSVINPMLEHYKKLVPHRKELHDSCRSLIYHSKAGNPHTMHYIFLVEDDRINIMGQSHFIIPNKRAFGMLFNVWVDRGDTEDLTFRSYVDVPPILPVEKHDDMMSVILMAIISAELFINFAEVETKLMKPNDRIWDEIGVNAIYNNKTTSDITVIDSTWYTNLVSSGAFKVRGHFRLQPYGPERSQRRLQWIADFQKEGYHRKAKKLKGTES